MPEYYILTKVKCKSCEGKGIISDGSYDTQGNDHAYDEYQCENCQGDGMAFEPIYITEELIAEIRRAFLAEREGHG